MKNFIFALLTLSTIFVSCNNTKQARHEVQWSASGDDSVMYVETPNQNGGMNNFFMNYLLFRTLFNSGGYASVTNYYHSHPAEFNNSGQYRNHYSNINPRIPQEAKITPSTSNYTSPSRKSTVESITNSASKSYSSPSRSSSNSYSSPSRSSSSYSSPSRSYSSGSSSYSSPSRSSYSGSSNSYSSSSSSSSSSRSYSSPSRGR